MLRIFLSLNAFLLLTGLLQGQPVTDDLPRVTNCIAITDVQLISAPGKAPQKSTVIIRDGLITHVGINAAIPADAYRLRGDSLYAYSAFIDAFSHTAIKEPENQSGPGSQGPPGGRAQRPQVDAEGNLPLQDAGITPFLSARATIDEKQKSISEWRALGFAIAHVVPRGRMIPGKGSLLLLTGENADQLIWKEDISLFSQWSGVGGNYPATVIGVMAKWRELYHNASNNVVHQSAYDKNEMVSRPDYNQAHEALRPVVNKEMPVFFKATKVKDISRALALQADLGMRMVIADAQQAWYLKDQFKSGATPLVLSLSLPEDKSEKSKDKDKEKEKEIEKEKGEKEKGEKEKPASVPTPDSLKTIEGEKPVEDPEKVAFEKRRNQSLAEHRAQAFTLASAGIPFSFGTMGVKSSDFFKNIRLMMEQGLNADQLLAALTTHPAKLLGIEKNAGTIEVGKMANIILSNKPVFEKDAGIRYVIVEGDLYGYELKEKKKKESKSEEDTTDKVSGTWSYTIESPDKVRKGTFEFSFEEGTIIGKIAGDDISSGNTELEDIVMDGDKLSFTFDMEVSGEVLEIEFDLTLTGETFDGTISALDMGSFKISGERIRKPEH